MTRQGTSPGRFFMQVTGHPWKDFTWVRILHGS